MIGIYKITSPSNRIYIGQSVDIEKRFKKYKAGDCKTQTKLYKSLLKYGYTKHKFEIIEICAINSLNERERYWQDFYESYSHKNLNCLSTSTNEKSGFMSKESRKKMSKSRTGISRPELMERLRKLNTGSKRSEESKLKMSLAQTGKKRSAESKMKQSIKARARKKVYTEEDRLKMRLSNGFSKKVQCIETGEIFLSLREYCMQKSLKYSTVWAQLRNKNKKLTIKYYEQL